MLVATAGHVDHGKSALIRALTGVETDRLEEERRRGLSIELGFAYKSLDDGSVLGFVDVPGHEKFIHNMLAGMPAIDVAMLVVAADDGPMPQTKEHLAIIELLGIRDLLVVLNKVDAVSPERLADARLELLELLEERGRPDAEIFEVSALRGDGISPLTQALEQRAEEAAQTHSAGSFRLAIDRSFVLSGTGLVITGAVFCGEVKPGDQVTLLPVKRSARVRAVHAQQQASDEGRAGQRCALNIAGSGIEASVVERGMWAVAGEAAHLSDVFEARIRVLDWEAKPLKHWAPVHLHLGAASCMAKVGLMEGNQLLGGQSGFARIVPSEPIHMVWGDRFVLRDASAQRTIGGGVVLNPFAPASNRRRAERLPLLPAFEHEVAQTALEAQLAQAELGMDLEQFFAARNLSSEAATELRRAVPMRLFEVDKRALAISSANWQDWKQRLLDGLSEEHREHPDEVGVKPDRAAQLMQLKRNVIGRAVVEEVTRELQSERAVVVRGGFLSLPDHKPVLDGVDQRWWELVQEHFAPQNLQPPAAGALAKSLEVDGKALNKFLERAAARGILARVSSNRYLHPAALATLAAVAQELANENQNQGFDAKTYKSRAGIGRNLAIQVLEFFDNAGLTRRVGDLRAVVGDHSALFGAS